MGETKERNNEIVINGTKYSFMEEYLWRTLPKMHTASIPIKRFIKYPGWVFYEPLENHREDMEGGKNLYHESQEDD